MLIKAVLLFTCISLTGIFLTAEGTSIFHSMWHTYASPIEWLSPGWAAGIDTCASHISQ